VDVVISVAASCGSVVGLLIVIPLLESWAVRWPVGVPVM
jgi:hypothetical protein